jgi:hypothetical protein
MSADDQWIQAELRNVAIPQRLAAQLREIGTLSDADLDAALRGVQPSLKLRDQLLSVGLRNDLDLDAELRLVPVPDGLLERCLAIPDQERDRSPLRRFAHWVAQRPRVWSLSAAAAVLLIVTLLSMNGRPVPGPQPGPIEPPQIAQNNAPVIELNPNPEKIPPVVTDLPPLKLPSKESLVQQSELPRLNEPELPIFAPPTPKLVNTAPAPEDVFGTNPRHDQLPELMSVHEPISRGVRPPSVREYDLIFQLRHGVHPFVSPAAHTDLKQVTVPLVSDGNLAGGNVGEQLALAFEQQRTLASGQPRVEDLLAAMNYEFRDPGVKQLGLNVAAGISPWNQQGLGLIQVGVQAGTVPRPNNQPAPVTLILDASAHVSREARWPMLLRGLEHWANDLQPADRVTLLIAGEQPQLIGRNLKPADLKQHLIKLRQQTARGTCQIASALSLAINDQLEQNSTIVFCTAGLLPLTTSQFSELNKSLPAKLAQTNSQLRVLDLRADQTSEHALQVLASWSSQAVVSAPNARQIHWQLREIVDRTSQIVAHDVNLRVTFVPEAVALYRLLGHEASAVSSLVPLEWQSDLRHCETATGLFEVALHPHGPEIIGQVELTWKDGAGKEHRRKQPLSRLQFASSFAEAPASLQIAALAAETAEVLRGSYFAPVATHDLQQLDDLSKRLPQRWQQKASMQQLQQLWKSARTRTR